MVFNDHSPLLPITDEHIHTQLKIGGAFNKFPDVFVQTFEIVVDTWKFSMLLLYILWHDWLILMISGSNQQLQQH